MKRMVFLLTFIFSFNVFGDIKSDLYQLIKKAWSKWQGVKGYTCIFIKQERIKGKLYPKETMFMKFRERPFSVYLKWIKDPHKGQEVLFVKGKNNNKIKAHKGGILGVINVNLDPYGSTAMKGNRHPITEAGLGNTIRLIKEDFELARKNNEGEFKDLGYKTIEGMKVHCYQAIMPKEKVKKGLRKKSKNEYYAAISEVCIDEKLGLPVVIKIYTDKKALLEMYIYKNLKLNPGLTDKDFDPDNDEYRF